RTVVARWPGARKVTPLPGSPARIEIPKKGHDPKSVLSYQQKKPPAHQSSHWHIYHGECENMLDTSRIRHLSPRSFLIIGCLALVALAICVALLFIRQSTPDQAPSTGVTLQVHIGFDGRYKDGSWVPVYISLSNTGTDFTGTLSISPPDSLTDSEWPSALYQSTIILPAGAQKRVTLYIPLKASIADPSTALDVQLFDRHNQLILTQSAFAYPLNPQDIFVGLLSDQPGNFN